VGLGFELATARIGSAVCQASVAQAVELFPAQEHAEAFIAEVERDEPELAALLRVEEVELV
jgi:RNase H-fold protein (predicted Holliday junction resolvase)